jgi:hypothetical protein
MIGEERFSREKKTVVTYFENCSFLFCRLPDFGLTWYHLLSKMVISCLLSHNKALYRQVYKWLKWHLTKPSLGRSLQAPARLPQDSARSRMTLASLCTHIVPTIMTPIISAWNAYVTPRYLAKQLRVAAELSLKMPAQAANPQHPRHQYYIWSNMLWEGTNKLPWYWSIVAMHGARYLACVHHRNYPC